MILLFFSIAYPATTNQTISTADAQTMLVVVMIIGTQLNNNSERCGLEEVHTIAFVGAALSFAIHVTNCSEFTYC